MKHLLLSLLICAFAAGCASQSKQPVMENGNGLGGANVAGSFPGSVGAGSTEVGSKATTGTSQGTR